MASCESVAGALEQATGSTRSAGSAAANALVAVGAEPQAASQAAGEGTGGSSATPHASTFVSVLQSAAPRADAPVSRAPSTKPAEGQGKTAQKHDDSGSPAGTGAPGEWLAQMLAPWLGSVTGSAAAGSAAGPADAPGAKDANTDSAATALAGTPASAPPPGSSTTQQSAPTDTTAALGAGLKTPAMDGALLPGTAAGSPAKAASPLAAQASPDIGALSQGTAPAQGAVSAQGAASAQGTDPASPAASAAAQGALALPGAASPPSHGATALSMPGQLDTATGGTDTGRGTRTDAPSNLPGATDAATALAAGTALGAPLHGAPAAATDAPVHTLAAPLGSAQWLEELGAHLTWMAHQGNQSASLQISPQDLGPIEVRIAVHQGQASVWFGAAHAETRQALEQGLPKLRELFASSGLALGDTGVFREPPRQAPPAIAQRHTGADNAQPSQPVKLVTRVRRGLLDLYA